MIFSQDRQTLRRMYRDAWRKHCTGETLSPLEAEIAAIVAEHPEYHSEVENADSHRDYPPSGGATNPFLHMGLHLGLREQVATDRPAGIRDLHRRIVSRARDRHDAEHRMVECLAETLWDAQSAGAPPDEARYLERLRRLAAL